MSKKVPLVSGAWGGDIRLEEWEYHDSTGDPEADGLIFSTDNARHLGSIEMGMHIVTLSKEQIGAIRDQCNRALGE